MKINLDYKRSEEAIKAITNSGLTLNYIEYAVESAHKNGLSGSQRRIYGRIQRKIDRAIEDEQDSVELEQAEKDFLRDAFRSSNFPANAAKYVVILEEEIQNEDA